MSCDIQAIMPVGENNLKRNNIEKTAVYSFYIMYTGLIIQYPSLNREWKQKETSYKKKFKKPIL